MYNSLLQSLYETLCLLHTAACQRYTPSPAPFTTYDTRPWADPAAAPAGLQQQHEAFVDAAQQAQARAPSPIPADSAPQWPQKYAAGRLPIADQEGYPYYQQQEHRPHNRRDCDNFNKFHFERLQQSRGGHSVTPKVGEEPLTQYEAEYAQQVYRNRSQSPAPRQVRNLLYLTRATACHVVVNVAVVPLWFQPRRQQTCQDYAFTMQSAVCSLIPDCPCTCRRRRSLSRMTAALPLTLQPGSPEAQAQHAKCQRHSAPHRRLMSSKLHQLVSQHPCHHPTWLPGTSSQSLRRRSHLRRL